MSCWENNDLFKKIKLELNIGIIGAGNFAGFAASAFTELPGVQVVAVTDIDADAAKRLADDCGAEVMDNMDSLLEGDLINLVYIATPPWLHYQQSKAALLKGKHVICEKPAALKAADAKELAEVAETENLLWVVNLMQRYNPLYQVVSKLVEEQLMGAFLHGYFENYASDENLPAAHWFWNENKSGGIFIEHAVHFFDMFEGWLGEGDIIHALQLKRPGFEPAIMDRVQATAKYAGGVVNFYHGFDQPKLLDRQELRLQFERGDVTLEEWVPVRMKLNGLVTEPELLRLRELSPNISLNRVVNDNTGAMKGRFKNIINARQLILEYHDTSDKQQRYRELLKDMLLDQHKWLENRAHVRKISSTNAVNSLKMAENAAAIAKNNSF